MHTVFRPSNTPRWFVSTPPIRESNGSDVRQPTSSDFTCWIGADNVQPALKAFNAAEHTKQICSRSLNLSNCFRCLTVGPVCSCLNLLHWIQNAAAHFQYNQIPPCDRLLHDLHWLPVVSCIQFKMMVLVFKAVNRTAPVYLQTQVRSHTPARELRSYTSAGQLVTPLLRANKGHSEKSRLFSVLEPQWWNALPTNVRTAESLSVFSRRLKTHLFRLHLDSILTLNCTWVLWPVTEL